MHCKLHWQGREAQISENIMPLKSMVCKPEIPDKTDAKTSGPMSCANLKSRHVIRWYVMVFPSRTRSAASDMQRELAYRERNGEPAFEYFAPSFVEVKEVSGRLVNTRRALLFNYIFLRASETEIYRMKQRLPQYNFLPRVNDKMGKYHYPYLSDAAMRNLQWIARSYEGMIPLYAADPVWLTKGDRIRITEGQFKDIEARIISSPRSKHKNIMVCIDNWMWVPLLQVRPGQYEVVELNSTGNRKYTHLNNDRLQENLHEALCRYQCGKTTDEDRALATEILLQYANLTMDSDIMRCKLYALLLPAYTILEQKEKCEGLIKIIQLMVSAIKAEQSRALLLVTLYGCMDSSIYYESAHATLAPWRTEENLRKSKAQLLRRLADYDRCLQHDANM